MVQRKGTLPVADSRSSGQGLGRSGSVAAASMVRGPTVPPALGGIFLLTRLTEPEEVSWNWSLCPKPAREPNSVQDKPLLGQGNHFERDKGTGKMKAPSEGKGGQSLRT